MRTVVSHTFVTLDGVATPDAVIDTIVELRNTKEVLDDSFGKTAGEDAMLLGRVTYEEWADYWPTSDTQPFADHINGVPKYVVSAPKRLRLADSLVTENGVAILTYRRDAPA